MSDPYEPMALWRFLPLGYFLSVLLETPVLWFGLSGRHDARRRIFAGIWLTACTYPIVSLVLPLVVEQRFGRLAYLAVAETFAPVAECGLFLRAFAGRGLGDEAVTVSWRENIRDCAAITIANLVSFAGGMLLFG